MSIAIQTEQLARTYRGAKGRAAIRAVDGVDLEVEQGAVLGLLGPNGAGKTTMVRIILAGVSVVAALLAALGVIISSRCGTVTTATQLSSFASMPIFGLVVYLGVRTSSWFLPQLLTLLIGLLAALVLLLRLGARALDREEIVARLD